MRAIKLLSIFLLLTVSSMVFAYGGSGSYGTTCQKLRLMDIKPAHLSLVAVQSEFSFKLPAETAENSISVVANKTPVSVVVKKLRNGYLVSGTLPASLYDKYVRVNVSTKSLSRCQGTSGWLLKILPIKP